MLGALGSLPGTPRPSPTMRAWPRRLPSLPDQGGHAGPSIQGRGRDATTVHGRLRPGAVLPGPCSRRKQQHPPCASTPNVPGTAWGSEQEWGRTEVSRVSPQTQPPPARTRRHPSHSAAGPGPGVRVPSVSLDGGVARARHAAPLSRPCSQRPFAVSTAPSLRNVAEPGRAASALSQRFSPRHAHVPVLRVSRVTADGCLLPGAAPRSVVRTGRSCLRRHPRKDVWVASKFGR